MSLQIVISFAGWTVVWLAILMSSAALETGDSTVLGSVATGMLPLAASLAALFTFALVGAPLLTWPWGRRSFGRRLEAQIEQMAPADLGEQIAQARGELVEGVNPGKRAALEAWIAWLEAKLRARSDGIRETGEAACLTLRPSPRKLTGTLISGAAFMLVGIWMLWLAVIGGDGGTGVAGFSGPNAVWTKSIIGGLIVLVTAIPMLEAATVRVELTAGELRKRAIGRRVWSLPRAEARLVLEGEDSWEVRDARTNRRVGELNPAHFRDGELLRLVNLLSAREPTSAES